MSSTTTSTQRSVMIIGLLGTWIENHPEIKITNDQMNAWIDEEEAKAKELGYYVQVEGVDPEQATFETRLDELKQAMSSRKWDGIGVGFGVRGRAEFTALFEKLVNWGVEFGAKGNDGKVPTFFFPKEPTGIVEALERVFSG